MLFCLWLFVVISTEHLLLPSTPIELLTNGLKVNHKPFVRTWFVLPFVLQETINNSISWLLIIINVNMQYFIFSWNKNFVKCFSIKRLHTHTQNMQILQGNICISPSCRTQFSCIYLKTDGGSKWFQYLNIRITLVSLSLCKSEPWGFSLKAAGTETRSSSVLVRPPPPWTLRLFCGHDLQITRRFNQWESESGSAALRCWCFHLRDVRMIWNVNIFWGQSGYNTFISCGHVLNAALLLCAAHSLRWTASYRIWILPPTRVSVYEWRWNSIPLRHGE